MCDVGIQSMPEIKEGDPGVALLLSACYCWLVVVTHGAPPSGQRLFKQGDVTLLDQR